jgi:NADPH:quinone reductase-like Zn-dependent oxidoreductase
MMNVVVSFDSVNKKYFMIVIMLFHVEVTGVDRTEKLEMMRTFGADDVIDYTKYDFTKKRAAI